MKKRRGALLVCLLLIAVTVVWERAEKKETEYTGGCMESLRFTVHGNMSQQELQSFQEEDGQVSYLFLPSYANMGNVKISFMGADAVAFSEGGEEIVLKDGDGLSELEIGKRYDMRFMGKSGTLEQGMLVVMHSSNLPALFLETESGSMEMLDADKDYEEPGRIVLYGADGSVVCADKLQRISGRGNSTWGYPKKSYGIRLKSPADLLDMGTAANWILLSNVEDNSYLRNKITYDMAIAAGMEGAPESRYIDLYINHAYHGMYLLCEKVEIDQERIPAANLNLENKRLNKDIQFASHFDEGDKKGVVLGMNPHDISGGYLLERDVSEKFSNEVSGFETGILHDQYTIKSPKYASEAEVDYISGLVCDMEKAVVAEDGINPDTGMHFTQYIDLRSFAQKYTIEELCKNNGGGATSSFFYKPEDAVSTKIFGGPVWDYDKGYGKVYGFDSSARNLCYLSQRGSGTVFFWHLSRHPEFQQMVEACYQEFFSDYMQRICDELIDTYASEMYASGEMDQIRWAAIYGGETTLGQRVDVIRSYLQERKAFLDEVWIEGREMHTVHFIAEDYERDTYMSVIAGECPGDLPIGEVGSVSDGLVFEGWYTRDGELFDGTEPLWEDITVYGAGHPEAEG